ncbi:MAG: hypothetical protein HKN42_11905 [Granulosicoccus sp.]|nr:hypothetical protein [Granulosicoccus sp.]
MADKIVKNYTGKGATVTWDSKLCIHVGECGRAKGELFETGRKPWCDPDTSSDEQTLDVVRRCPTGSLSVVFSDPSKGETCDPENTITVVYGGPLILRGQLDIQDAPADAPALKFRAALCRCGMSRNKPFCDNSHATADFSDSGAVGETGTPLEDTGGALTVAIKQNGPLRITGNMRIISGSGRPAWQGTSAVLCRCGMSGNKPFCDGTHRKRQWQDN